MVKGQKVSGKEGDLYRFIRATGISEYVLGMKKHEGGFDFTCEFKNNRVVEKVLTEGNLEMYHLERC